MGQKFVFISYNVGHDGEYAEKLRQAFESNGYSYWMAPGSIAPGASYPEQIVGALSNPDCDVFLLLVSSGSNMSENCKNELSLAFDFHKRIVPVLLEDIKFNDLFQYYLKRSQWVTANNGISFESVFSEITGMLDSYRNNAGVPTPETHSIINTKSVINNESNVRRMNRHSSVVQGYESSQMADILASGKPGESEGVTVCGYDDLYDRGLDIEAYERVLAQKIARDDDAIDESMRLIDSQPMNWKLLLTTEGKIAGYWIFIALEEEFYEEVMTGSVHESEISLEDAEFLDLPGRYKGYILLSGTVPKLRLPNIVQLLYGSLIEHIEFLAESGIFFDEIGSMVSSTPGISGMKSLGLKEVAEYLYGGKMFQIQGKDLKKSRFFKRYEKLISLYEEEFADE